MATPSSPVALATSSQQKRESTLRLYVEFSSPFIATAAGDSTENPLYLYHSITIDPGRSLVITCKDPIPLENGMTIHPRLPLKLEAPQHKQLTLRPDFRLTPEFARGWNNLPVELKTRILERNLSNLLGTSRKHGLRQGDEKTILFRYLRMTPEIAHLSREIYYKNNTFMVSMEINRIVLDFHRARYENVACYPPRSGNRFIRTVNISIEAKRSLREYWPMIQRMDSGGYGFQNLRFVGIRVRNLVPAPKLLDGLPVLRLRCKGALWLERPFGIRPLDLNDEDFDEAMQEILTFDSGAETG